MNTQLFKSKLAQVFPVFGNAQTMKTNNVALLHGALMNGKEIIKNFYEAQAKQDVQGMADVLAENIVFEMPFALPGLPDRVFRYVRHLFPPGNIDLNRQFEM